MKSTMLRGLSPLRSKRRSSPKNIILGLLIFIVVCLWNLPARPVAVGALTQQHVMQTGGIGGRWYIPNSWLQRGQVPFGADDSILDAAERALSLALTRQAYVNNSRVPLIAHQTWRDLDANTWSNVIKGSVEQWIEAAVGENTPDYPEMAWFLWDDDGIDALIRKYEPALYDKFRLLPYPVEKADVFRVVVLKWFGGIYADVDCNLLKHPFDWVHSEDLQNWTQAYSHTTHTLHDVPGAFSIPSNAPQSWKEVMKANKGSKQSNPAVHAIFGIEADNLPPPDESYWRMGYSYPVQLTNWALAMAPQHPVADQFIETLSATILANQTRLRAIDPLDITGPPALTAAVQSVAHRDAQDLNWDSLSGRTDPAGGRGKIVSGDVLVLPITGFSPGRGWFHNMGSKGISHPNARLQHAAAGSWRKVDVKVEAGKFCRTFLGYCKDWKKIPQ